MEGKTHPGEVGEVNHFLVFFFFLVCFLPYLIQLCPTLCLNHLHVIVIILILVRREKEWDGIEKMIEREEVGRGD